MIYNIKAALHNKGYTIRVLTERLWNKGVWLSYQAIDRYCLAWDRRYGRPAVWEKIDECLKEMGVM